MTTHFILIAASILLSDNCQDAIAELIASEKYYNSGFESSYYDLGTEYPIGHPSNVKRTYKYSLNGESIHSYFDPDSLHTKKTGYIELIFAYNTMYCFNIVKEKGKDEYKLLTIASRNDQAFEQIKRKIALYSMNLPSCPHLIYGKPLSVWQQTKGFRVTDCKTIGDILQLTVDYDAGEQSYKLVTIPSFSATLTFDKLNKYAAVSSNVVIHLKTNGKAIKNRIANYKIKYGNIKSELFPESCLIEIGDINNYEINRTIPIIDYRKYPIHESEFKLSKFGMQEPSWLKEGTNNPGSAPWFLYVSLAGILCMIAALIIQHRRNKQASL